MDVVRLGIIGFGQQGGYYASLLDQGRVEHMRLGAVCDVDPVKRELASATYPGTRVYADVEELLASGEVDAVVTTVPHYLHPPIGIAALRAGLHVLVEKPIGVYARQAAELVHEAESRPELVFGVMFNQRTNPLYQRIKRIVDAGEIGAIRRSSWNITTWWRPQEYYRMSAWRATWGGEGGGVLVNQAPHQLDLWQWICGMPRSVVAILGYGVGRDIVVENEATVLAEYDDGATGEFATCTNDIVGTDRFEILGTAGKIVVEGSSRATVYRLTSPEPELSAGIDPERVKRFLMGDFDATRYFTSETFEEVSAWGQQHADVLENFALAIVEGAELIAPGSDGLAAVRLANAIHHSSWTGGSSSLDLDPDEFVGLLNERIEAEGLFPAQS